MSGSLVGKQLGTFRLDRLLGQGGMAAVYYGWDLQLERPSAVKVVDTHGSRDPAYAVRAMREARLAAGWRHDNIIQIYYADEQDGLYYFAMEYIEGLNLEEVLAQYAAEGRLMPQDDVLRMSHAVAGALDYAHERGVIHRDVKPANVLVAGDGRVVLTDFGLALDVVQGTRGETFGTASYIAPEQARSSAAAVPQSDLYSLGVILYEMLTGAVPFQDRSATCVALQHLTQPPPPPRERNPQLNAGTEAVLLKALAKDPAERYQSGAALLDALETALRAPEPAAPIMRLPSLPATAAPSISDLSVGDRVASFMQAGGSSSVDEDVHLYDPDADLIGRQLDEYRLEELLGHGGMARVYRGLDVRLNRPAAVKVIDTPYRADPEYMARFEREAQAIARLDHPNIVRLYRFGEAEGLLYMAMQYIDGEDLGTVLSKIEESHDSLAPERIKGIVREIGEALDYAHSLDVIHRDVKPANIMLDRYGRSVLTDFGLALMTEVGTRGTVFGSPLYIAPEQVISSANVVPQSDLYAMGVILYRIFTGQLPFDAENPMDVALLRLDQPPRPPRELRPDLDPAVETVILKAMARDVEDRYASGKELAAALEQAIDTQAEREPSTSAVHEVQFPVRVAAKGRRTAPDASTMARTRAAPPRPAAAGPAPSPVSAPAAAKPASSPASAEAAAKPAPPPASPPAPAAPRKPAPKVSPLAFLAGLKSLLFKKLSPLYAAIILAACLLLTAGGLGIARLAGGLVSQTPAAAGPTQTADASMSRTAAVGHATLSPRNTPVNTPAPSPVPPAVGGQLRLYRLDDKGILVVNAATAPLSLAPLRLGEKRGAVDGSVWNIDQLASGDCVAAWAERGTPEIPEGVTCNLVGVVQAGRGKDSFWDESFSVYYSGERVGTCDKETDECEAQW